jgi:O-antigen/teichoic acid export membrane protein
MLKSLYKQQIKALRELFHSKVLTHYTGEGIRRYTKNIVWPLLTRVGGGLIALFVTIYLARYLGPTNYGHLSYAVSFVGLFAIIGTLGIDNVLYRELIQHPDKKNEYLGSAFVLKFCAGLIAAIFTIASAFIFPVNDVSNYVILMLSLTFVFNSFNVITYEFQAHVNQKPLSIAAFTVVMTLNVLKLGVVFLDKGVLYIGGLLVLESILYAVFFTYIRIRYYGSLLHWQYKPELAKAILINSWPFIFIALFSSVYARIDQVMLKHLIDSSAVGIYDAAVRIAEMWLFVPGIIASSLFPAILNGKKSSIHEYKKRILTLTGFLVTVATILATLTSLIAHPLMLAIYGPAFSESAGVFSIYIWSGVFVSVSIVLHYFLLAENKRKVIFFSSLGTMVLNVLLNLLLIPIFGITGAAFATLISYAILVLPIILIFRLK